MSEVEENNVTQADPASSGLKQPFVANPTLPVEKKTLEATETGVLIGSTFEEQYRMARVFHASGLMPKALDSVEKVFVAVQLLRELRLPAMSCIGKVAVINQTPYIFGDLPLALVQRSGLLSGIKEEFVFDEKGTLVGAYCSVQRKNFGTTVRNFSIDDAKKASLWGKTGPWSLYPKRMLQMRSRSWALKDAFSDVLLGASILEYDHVEEKDVTPNKDASDIESLYLNDQEKKES